MKDPSLENHKDRFESGPRRVPGEDSVKQDVDKAKGLISKFFGRIAEIITPFVKKGSERVSTTLQSRAAGAKLSLPKIIKPVAVALALLFVVILGYSLFRRYFLPAARQVDVAEPFSTPPPFKTFEPSIYADDAEILAIEEELAVMERELDNISILQSNLNPPRLDWDINFEE